jgi:hypothetical protein
MIECSKARKVTVDLLSEEKIELFGGHQICLSSLNRFLIKLPAQDHNRRTPVMATDCRSPVRGHNFLPLV